MTILFDGLSGCAYYASGGIRHLSISYDLGLTARPDGSAASAFIGAAPPWNWQLESHIKRHSPSGHARPWGVRQSPRTGTSQAQVHDGTAMGAALVALSSVRISHACSLTCGNHLDLKQVRRKREPSHHEQTARPKDASGPNIDTPCAAKTYTLLASGRCFRQRRHLCTRE